VIDRCRRRVVEVETQRGDRETAASALAMDLRWTGGLETVARAVSALGKTHFARTFGWAESGASRQETLSHLVVRSVPRAEDTPEAFARWAREARVPEARLVELALYAPQWAAHVNHVLRWPGFEGAVWWIQAHTKDDRSWRLHEMKELWAAEVSERTPLPAADLTEGGVDVEWFRQVYAEIGTERWRALDAAAKYAASSAGHTRAQLFARAIAGLVTRDELFGRIDSSRHQDAVRALGLLPWRTARPATATCSSATSDWRSSAGRPASSARSASRAKAAPWPSDSRTSRARRATATRSGCSGRWSRRPWRTSRAGQWCSSAAT